ncbi:hypothetical protein [Brevundimonas sp. UBA7534]|uniref:hypothetical protein n=1 Tax=Brevundimonas sp. UBA7534 TaxID=1946138 RepID=UPI0025BA57E2|nr:hypothetical protein [Brevundimonas sp. UBA7534]
MYPPLKNGLAHHFSAPDFIPGGQTVYVGVRPLDDGWVIAVVRIDDCADEAEAVWLGSRIRTDMLAHMRFTNQEDVPLEAVDVEQGVPVGGSAWSVAVYVTLSSMREAETMVAFLTAYAEPGLYQE